MNAAVQGAPARAISLADFNTEINHEPRVLDVRLAEALDFERPRDIRPLIERHLEALEEVGGVCGTVPQTSQKGGRPAKQYWLTLDQVIYICTKSDKPLAVRVTIDAVRAYSALLTGRRQDEKALPPPPPKPAASGLRAPPVLKIVPEHLPPAPWIPDSAIAQRRNIPAAKLRAMIAANEATLCALGPLYGWREGEGWLYLLNPAQAALLNGALGGDPRDFLSFYRERPT